MVFRTSDVAAMRGGRQCRSHAGCPQPVEAAMRWLVGWSSTTAGPVAGVRGAQTGTLQPVGAQRLWDGPDPLWAVGDWRPDEIRVVYADPAGSGGGNGRGGNGGSANGAGSYPNGRPYQRSYGGGGANSGGPGGIARLAVLGRCGPPRSPRRCARRPSPG